LTLQEQSDALEQSPHVCNAAVCAAWLDLITHKECKGRGSRLLWEQQIWMATYQSTFL